MLLSGGFNNWFDSASERPQCLQKREHNILIATASSNAKNTDLNRKGIKKYTNFNTKYQTINNKKSNTRWLGSAGKSAYKSIPEEWIQRGRPVIWSVELEYYQVVTAIALLA